MATELERYTEIFPGIKWDEPIKMVLTTGESGYACRICIANHGIRGSDIRMLPATAESVIAHIQEAHTRA